MLEAGILGWKAFLQQTTTRCRNGIFPYTFQSINSFLIIVGSQRISYIYLKRKSVKFYICYSHNLFIFPSSWKIFHVFFAWEFHISDKVEEWSEIFIFEFVYLDVFHSIVLSSVKKRVGESATCFCQ